MFWRYLILGLAYYSQRTWKKLVWYNNTLSRTVNRTIGFWQRVHFFFEILKGEIVRQSWENPNWLNLTEFSVWQHFDNLIDFWVTSVPYSVFDRESQFQGTGMHFCINSVLWGLVATIYCTIIQISQNVMSDPNTSRESSALPEPVPAKSQCRKNRGSQIEPNMTQFNFQIWRCQSADLGQKMDPRILGSDSDDVMSVLVCCYDSDIANSAYLKRWL